MVQTFANPTFGIRVADAAGNEAVRYQFRTDRLLRELAFPDAFALIFIATDEGDVLYQNAPARRRWLRHLRWGEQNFRDAQADRPPVLQIRNLRELLAGNTATWNQLRAVSSRTAVEIGGTAHQLYLQPLTLEHGKRTGLVIGGAVPTNTIVTDALALDASVVAVLVFLLLLGVFGFPFVKLTSLAARERFGLWDINLLYLSSGALLVLMTCGSLALDGYVRWRAVADKGLAGLAADLEKRFLTEVAEIRDQVADYDAMVGNMPVQDCDQWSVYTRWYKQDPEPHGQHLPTAVASDAWVPWPTRNVHIRQVAWIQADGWQVWKVTSDAIPGKSQVNQRPYFRAVQNGNLFQISHDDRPFFISSDRSVADGKFYTYFSMPSTISPTRCARSETIAGQPVVAAIAYLMSLDRQPLPAGYGFALINREGRVLYHSDGRLSLRENFFEELSEGAAVRAMVYANREDALDSRYRELPHSLYLRPVGLRRFGEDGPAGFYLVTFRNTTAERALVGHVFLTGLIVPMAIFMALYAGGFAIIARAARSANRRWSEWFWPHGGLDHIYKRQAVASAALLLASAGLYLVYQTVVPFLLIPIVAVAVDIAIYAHGTRRPTTRHKLGAPGWQTSSIVLVLVCLVTAPSAALFRLKLSHEFARLILTERDWIDSQGKDMVRASASETLTDEYAASRIERLAHVRRGYFGCLPAPFNVANPHLPGPASPQSGRPEVQRTAYRPIQAAPGGDRPQDGRRAWRSCGTRPDDPAGGDSTASAMLQPIGMANIAISGLHVVDGILPPVRNEILERQQFQLREFAYSPEGTVVTLLRVSGIALLGFALTFAPLIWWIRWNTNRVFLADREANASATPASESFDQIWAKRTADEQMVLLQVARDRIANPHQKEMIDQLLKEGVLRIEPDLRPFSADFDTFLQQKRRELRAQLRDWEYVKDGHSWRYVRLILVASMAALGAFLFATQPSLQSNLVTVTSALAGVLTAALKLREAVMSWLAKPGTAA